MPTPSQKDLPRRKSDRIRLSTIRSSRNSFCLTMRCALPHHRMIFCSSLPKAPMMQLLNSENGTGQPWKKRSPTCIHRVTIGNLNSMVGNMHTRAEHDAWGRLAQGWRQLYGDFDREGVSVQWHDFRSAQSVDWGRSFHPRSLEFCLNLE